MITAKRAHGNVFDVSFASNTANGTDDVQIVQVTLGQKVCPVSLRDGASLWDAKRVLRACWAAIAAEAEKAPVKRATLRVAADWKHGRIECHSVVVRSLGEASPAQKAEWLRKYEATSGKRMAKAIAMCHA